MSEADWQRVHNELTRLARSKAALDAEEAHWLVEAARIRVHEPLGFGSMLEYLERLFGYGPRSAKERVRVAEALCRLPALRDSMASGDLAWSAVRELSRVATPATEAEWIAAARGKTVRQVEDLVSGRRSGDHPDDPVDPGLRRHVLRLEISADALAAFRDARRHLEVEVGHSLEDDEMVRLLAHGALDGGREAGRAAYQVAMTVCTECRRGTRDGAGRVFAVEPAHVDAAMCDAQQVSIDVRTSPQTHVGRPESRPVPATQSIPPRIRRLVWRRDHGRCQAPGCRSARHLEIHHVIPRSEGGDHDPSRLLLLCTARHVPVHTGHLRIAGIAPDQLVFTHADGTEHGAPHRASGPRLRADGGDGHSTQADAVGALRRTGVALGDARRAVAEAARSQPASIEELVRREYP